MGANRSKYRRGSGKEWCLRKYGVELIGASYKQKKPNRQLFKEAMGGLG